MSEQVDVGWREGEFLVFGRGCRPKVSLQPPSRGRIDPDTGDWRAIWLCLNLILEQILTGPPGPSSEHRKSLARLRSYVPASVQIPAPELTGQATLDKGPDGFLSGSSSA